MEDQTTIPTPDLRNRITSLGPRAAILVLDIAALTTLAVSLSLYSKWIPATSYPTTALNPITNTDKTDWIVLAAIVISIIWTIFITMRLTLTHKAPHPALTTAFDLVCLVWLVACIIPAFVLRESSLGNLAAISNTCDVQAKDAPSLAGGGAAVNLVCQPHLDTLKKVQIAAYSVACVIALLHLTLSAIGCRSIMQQRSRDRSSALIAAAQHIEKDTVPHHDHEEPTTITSNNNDSNRRSESASSSSTQHQNPRVEVSEF